ncbi:phage major capsid protein [Shewanella sp. SE1]|uniref:phage major capsid protein n=1 Tax=Shewanella sp. SE1 TaxID=2705014 RepID=UPI00138F27C9|nr:phage major capsid protein [Shewanella sp. SE1]NDO73067.1 phage major capsid protein [Shewanella sp. SE1]
MEIEKQIKSAIDAATEMKTAHEAETKKLNDELTELKNAVHDLKQVKTTVADTELTAEDILKSKEIKKFQTEIKAKSNAIVDLKEEMKGFTIADGDSAGALLEQELERQILVPLKDGYSLAAALNIRTVSNKDFKRPVQVNSSATRWVGENSDNAPLNNTGTPKFKMIAATWGTVEAFPYVTRQAMNDQHFDLMAFLTNDVATQISDSFGQAVIDGAGENIPNGILAHFDDGTESLKVDGVRSVEHYQYLEAAADLTDEQLIEKLQDLTLEMGSKYLGSAAFWMNRKMFARVSRIKNANGDAFLQTDLSKSAAGTLFGYPVRIEAHLPDFGVGSIPVLFGDVVKAFELMVQGQSSMFQLNPYLVPGNVQVYSAQDVGTCMYDCRALKGLKVIAA